MSMIGILLRITEKQLEEFIADSVLLEEFADADDIEESGNQLYLDKSWDAINFLLTGHSLDSIESAEPPLSGVVFSGQIIDEEQDMGYGPAQYLTPTQVKEINDALVNISSDEFRNRYDPVKLKDKGIYPQSWEDDENEKDYLTNYFNDLKTFYSKAAKEGQAIVTYIT
jgi:hypothetical protein